MERLDRSFFEHDAATVAKELVGKTICNRVSASLYGAMEPSSEGIVFRTVITETEAYLGENDTACHASHGRTRRTEPIYRQAGVIYVYLCYGVHDLMNISVSKEGDPQCVLLRAGVGAKGPGLLTRLLHIDRSYNLRDIATDPDIWIEHDGSRFDTVALPRVGLRNVSEKDRAALLRFKL